MNLFSKKETDPEKEAEYLTEMLLKKNMNGELNLYIILTTCKRIYELGRESRKSQYRPHTPSRN